MGDRQPWHQAPPCPICGGAFGIPQGADFMRRRFGDEQPDPAPNAMRCAACGARWDEDDPAAVARAWYGAGAYDGAQAKEHEMEDPGA